MAASHDDVIEDCSSDESCGNHGDKPEKLHRIFGKKSASYSKTVGENSQRGKRTRDGCLKKIVLKESKITEKQSGLSNSFKKSSSLKENQLETLNSFEKLSSSFKEKRPGTSSNAKKVSNLKDERPLVSNSSEKLSSFKEKQPGTSNNVEKVSNLDEKQAITSSSYKKVSSLLEKRSGTSNNVKNVENLKDKHTVTSNSSEKLSSHREKRLKNSNCCNSCCGKHTMRSAGETAALSRLSDHSKKSVDEDRSTSSANVGKNIGKICAHEMRDENSRKSEDVTDNNLPEKRLDSCENVVNFSISGSNSRDSKSVEVKKDKKIRQKSNFTKVGCSKDKNTELTGNRTPKNSLKSRVGEPTDEIDVSDDEIPVTPSNNNSRSIIVLPSKKSGGSSKAITRIIESPNVSYKPRSQGNNSCESSNLSNNRKESEVLKNKSVKSSEGNCDTYSTFKGRRVVIKYCEDCCKKYSKFFKKIDRTKTFSDLCFDEDEDDVSLLPNITLPKQDVSDSNRLKNSSSLPLSTTKASYRLKISTNSYLCSQKPSKNSSNSPLNVSISKTLSNPTQQPHDSSILEPLNSLKLSNNSTDLSPKPGCSKNTGNQESNLNLSLGDIIDCEEIINSIARQNSRSVNKSRNCSLKGEEQISVEEMSGKTLSDDESFITTLDEVSSSAETTKGDSRIGQEILLISDDENCSLNSRSEKDLLENCSSTQNASQNQSSLNNASQNCSSVRNSSKKCILPKISPQNCSSVENMSRNDSSVLQNQSLVKNVSQNCSLLKTSSQTCSSVGNLSQNHSSVKSQICSSDQRASHFEAEQDLRYLFKTPNTPSLNVENYSVTRSQSEEMMRLNSSTITQNRSTKQANNASSQHEKRIHKKAEQLLSEYEESNSFQASKRKIAPISGDENELNSDKMRNISVSGCSTGENCANLSTRNSSDSGNAVISLSENFSDDLENVTADKIIESESKGVSSNGSTVSTYENNEKSEYKCNSVATNENLVSTTYNVATNENSTSTSDNDATNVDPASTTNDIALNENSTPTSKTPTNENSAFKCDNVTTNDNSVSISNNVTNESLASTSESSSTNLNATHTLESICDKDKFSLTYNLLFNGKRNDEIKLKNELMLVKLERIKRFTAERFVERVSKFPPENQLEVFDEILKLHKNVPSTTGSVTSTSRNLTADVIERVSSDLSLSSTRSCELSTLSAKIDEGNSSTIQEKSRTVLLQSLMAPPEVGYLRRDIFVRNDDLNDVIPPEFRHLRQHSVIDSSSEMMPLEFRISRQNTVVNIGQNSGNKALESRNLRQNDENTEKTSSEKMNTVAVPNKPKYKTLEDILERYGSAFGDDQDHFHFSYRMKRFLGLNPYGSPVLFKKNQSKGCETQVASLSSSTKNSTTNLISATSTIDYELNDDNMLINQEIIEVLDENVLPPTENRVSNDLQSSNSKQVTKMIANYLEKFSNSNKNTRLENQSNRQIEQQVITISDDDDDDDKNQSASNATSNNNSSKNQRRLNSVMSTSKNSQSKMYGNKIVSSASTSESYSSRNEFSDSNLQESDCNILESNCNLLKSDSNLQESDSNLLEPDSNKIETGSNLPELESNSLESDSNLLESDSEFFQYVHPSSQMNTSKTSNDILSPKNKEFLKCVGTDKSIQQKIEGIKQKIDEDGWIQVDLRQVERPRVKKCSCFYRDTNMMPYVDSEPCEKCVIGGENRRSHEVYVNRFLMGNRPFVAMSLEEVSCSRSLDDWAHTNVKVMGQLRMRGMTETRHGGGAAYVCMEVDHDFYLQSIDEPGGPFHVCIDFDRVKRSMPLAGKQIEAFAELCLVTSSQGGEPYLKAMLYRDLDTVDRGTLRAYSRALDMMKSFVPLFLRADRFAPMNDSCLDEEFDANKPRLV